jgi:hypothetical protein
MTSKNKGESGSPRLVIFMRARLAEFARVLLQFALHDPLRVFPDHLIHFFRREAQFQILVCFVFCAAIAEFLFAILHRKQIKVMGIVETAHYHFLVIARAIFFAHSNLRSRLDQ